MEFCEILVDHGCSIGLTQLTKADIPNLLKSTSLNCAILMIKAELDQFVKGLDEAGVVHMIQKYPDLFQQVFVTSETTSLSAGMCLFLCVLCLILYCLFV